MRTYFLCVNASQVITTTSTVYFERDVSQIMKTLSSERYIYISESICSLNKNYIRYLREKAQIMRNNICVKVIKQRLCSMKQTI